MEVLDDGTAGPVKRAVAQSTPGCPGERALGPTMLFDEVVAPTSASGSCTSREIDISRFRQVVIHREVPDGSTELKLGEAAGFVRINTLSPFPAVQVIDPQQGRLLRFRWGATLAGVCGTRAFTVVGYGDAVQAPLPPPPITADPPN